MADAKAGGPATPIEQETDVEVSDDKKLSNLVNSAVSTHLKRALPKFLEDAITPHMAALKELVAPKPAEPAAPAANAAQTTGTDPAILKQLEDMKAQLKKEQDTRARERQQAREEKAISDVRAALVGKVRPEAVEHLIKVMVHDRVIQTDGAMVTLKIGDDVLDLKEGLQDYLARKEHAIFLPAPGYNQAPKAGKQPRPVAPPRTGPNGTVQRTEREDPLQKTLRDLGHI